MPQNELIDLRILVQNALYTVIQSERRISQDGGAHALVPSARVKLTMNDFDDMSESVRVTDSGKKRKRDKEHHKREIEKKNRHDGENKNPRIACVHGNANNRQKTRFCRASQLNDEDIAFNHQTFYATSDKVIQDQALLQLMTISAKKRRQPNMQHQRKRDIVTKYKLLTKDHPVTVPVCKETFSSVLGRYLLINCVNGKYKHFAP